MNEYRAKGDNKFNKKKRELLDDLINNINKNGKEIITKYCIPLLDNASSAISRSNYKLLDIKAKTVSRLLINTASGLGKNIFEVGINIHPLFSIPYIPSSSIKGSLRSYIYTNYKEKVTIFGNQERMGRLIILDSFPIEYKNRLIDGEVTTPIYGSEDEFEEHKVSPKPIIYPCIARDVTFRFIIAFDSDELKQEIKEYFFSMLREGIGAKTLLGYGEFDNKLV